MSRLTTKQVRALRDAVAAGWRVNIDTHETRELCNLALAALEQRDLLVLSGATDEEVTRQQQALLSPRRVGRGKQSGV